MGSVFAGGLVSINAQHSIYQATDALNITGTNIDLQAQGNIGASTAALQVQVGNGGALSGSAGGAAYIYGPSKSNQAPVTLSVSNFTSGLAMDLTADGPVRVTGITASNGTLTVGSGANATVMNATSGGAMTLTAVGSLIVGGLSATGSNSQVASAKRTVPACRPCQ